MPYGSKEVIKNYLCLIIEPDYIEINDNIKDKNNYLETYLIILILYKTNHFSKFKIKKFDFFI